MLNVTIVIDDSESDRYLVRRALSKAGVCRRVLEFPGGREALDLFADRERFAQECGPWPPRAVVLLDINMPRMSGFEFLEAIERRIAAGELFENALAVVMYSTSEHESDVDHALSHRIVVDYMVKPITVEDAVRIVHAAQSFDTAS